MEKFVYFFIATLAFATVLAKKSTTEKSLTEQFIQNIETVRKDVEASLQKVLLDNKDVNKVILDYTKTFAATIEKGTQELKENVNKSKPLFDDLVKEASARISESITFLKGLVGDDVVKKGEEARKTIDTHIKNIFDEGKRIEDAVRPNIEHIKANVKQFAINFFQDLATAGERLRADIDKTLEKVQNNKMTDFIHLDCGII